MKQLSRRYLLHAGTVGTAGLLAGCTFDNRSVSGGHLFAVNPNENSQRLVLVVARTTANGDPALVSAVYEIPPQTALQFEGVLTPEETLRIRANQPESGREEALSLTPKQCDSGDENDVMDVSVRIAETGQLSIITWRCDEQYVYHEDLEYVEPMQHRVATVTPSGSG